MAVPRFGKSVTSRRFSLVVRQAAKIRVMIAADSGHHPDFAPQDFV